MPNIANFSIEELCDRVGHFNQDYINDWKDWIKTLSWGENVAFEFGRILRKWQACRPNTMRCISAKAEHAAPFLEDLINQSHGPLSKLRNFQVGDQKDFAKKIKSALHDLWSIFEQLSYRGGVRGGLTGVVGISKAVLLLSEGQIGPAFDSTVRRELNIDNISCASDWVTKLQWVSSDIMEFEKRTKHKLSDAVPPSFATLKNGRLYDMIFGPR